MICVLYTWNFLARAYLPWFKPSKTNQIARRHRELTIMKHNEEFYARLSKLENTESAFLREQKRHQRHIKGQAEYSRRLKAHGRRLKVDKINRENEHMHHRIQNASPFYSRKKFAEEYQRNLDQINAGTKTDFTAGHLLHIPKKLRPLPLKKIHKKGSLEDKMDQLRKASSKKNSKLLSSSLSSSEFIYEASDMSANRAEGNSFPQESQNDSKLVASDVEESYEEDYEQDPENSFEQYDSFGENHSSYSQDEVSIASSETITYGGEKIMLSSRPFALPYDTKNCYVEAYMSKDYDEEIVFKCVSASDRSHVITERSISIDDVHVILDASRSCKRVSGSEDLMAIRTILTNMFREADTAGRGYLSYDEFQKLLQKINFGISAEELLFVISEADEDESGYVDYQEFIPLAVDMIQAFAARGRARNESIATSVDVDDQVLQKLATEELQMMFGVLETAIKEVDVKDSGFIRIQELRSILRKNMSLGISEMEVNMICQSIPRDNLGRCDISHFRKTFFDVRFLTMKNTIVESQASDLEKYLFDLCKEEEKRLREVLINDVHFLSLSHMIPLRNIINMMIASPRLSLNRLQVVVIASEAHVVDGYVDYRQFVPVAAKTIEIMYEPHALKQRAELIEKTDLTPEALLQGQTPEVFKRRLLVLFKSCDTDKSGFLDMKEFRSCLESLDLKLSPQEINALMASADSDGNGTIDFEEFADFCAHNLLHLEREKHIRALRDSMESHDQESDLKNAILSQFDDAELDAHILKIFKAADTNQSGSLSHFEIRNLFESLEINLSSFELSVLISEADVNNDGLIDYEEFVPVCADLLRVMSTNDKKVQSKTINEDFAHRKVAELEFSIKKDMERSSRYLTTNLDVAMNSIEDPHEKAKAIKDVLQDPRSGLGRAEVNTIFVHLLEHDTAVKNKKIVTNSDVNSAIDHATNESIASISILELEEIIFEVRKQSVVRGFLETYNHAYVLDQINGHLKPFVRSSAVEDDLVEWVPIRKVFECLENLSSIRLRRSQITLLLTQLDCYDEDYMNLDLHKLANTISNSIEDFVGVSNIEARALAIRKGNISVEKVMNEITEEQLVTILKDSLAPYGVRVGDQQVAAILTDIPGLYLSKREASAAVASIERSAGHEDKINVQEFIRGAYETVHVVCQERFIARRTKLLKHRLCDGEVLEVTVLVDRIFDVMKLRAVDDSIEIAFVSDMENSRLSGLLKTPPGTSDAVRNQEADDARTVSMSGETNSLLLRFSSSLTVEAYRQKKSKSMVAKSGGRASFGLGGMMSLVNKATSAALERAPDQTMYGIISIYENDVFTFPEKAPIEFHFSSADSSFSSSIGLPIRMPSVGIVDSNMAEYFAKGIVKLIYIELMVDAGVYELKFSPDRHDQDIFSTISP